MIGYDRPIPPQPGEKRGAWFPVSNELMADRGDITAWIADELHESMLWANAGIPRPESMVNRSPFAAYTPRLLTRRPVWPCGGLLKRGWRRTPNRCSQS